MNYMDWLAERYEPRFVTPHELEKGEKQIKPLDFLPIKCWKDLQMIAEKKTELKHSTDKNCEKNLDLTFVSCQYEDLYSGEGYEGSVVAVTPYDAKNRVPHADFKDFLTSQEEKLDFLDKLREYVNGDLE